MQETGLRSVGPADYRSDSDNLDTPRMTDRTVRHLETIEVALTILAIVNLPDQTAQCQTLIDLIPIILKL